MNGPPPGPAALRRRATSAARAPGRRAAPSGAGPRRTSGSCPRRRARPSRSRRRRRTARRTSAVVAELGCRPGRPRPRSRDPRVDEPLLLRGDRDAGDRGRRSARRRAATASPSRSRRRAASCPARGRACGRPGPACRAAPARAETSGVDVVAAGVGHLRLEDQRVELVGQVVVEADRAAGRAAGCAAGRGAVACEAGAAGGRPRAPIPAAVRTAASSAGRRRSADHRSPRSLRHGERVGEGVRRGRRARRARR